MSWKITAYCGNRCCNGKWAWQCSWSGHNNGELSEDELGKFAQQIKDILGQEQ